MHRWRNIFALLHTSAGSNPCLDLGVDTTSIVIRGTLSRPPPYVYRRIKIPLPYHQPSSSSEPADSTSPFHSVSTNQPTNLSTAGPDHDVDDYNLIGTELALPLVLRRLDDTISDPAPPRSVF